MSRRSPRDQPELVVEPDAPAPVEITGDGSGETLPPIEPDEVTAVETVAPPDLQVASPAGEDTRPLLAGEGKREVYLTTRVSERFGPRGAFVTPTAAELDEAPEGLLVRPTPEQLAARP